jgi:CrcB protein
MAGGALGTLSRYYVSGYSHKLLAGLMPWGTLVVNVSGAFLIGLFWGLFEMKDVSPHTRTFFAIGFLGGFTTFSTFALETMNLLKENEFKLAVVNVFANNVLAIVFVFAGYFLATTILTYLKQRI